LILIALSRGERYRITEEQAAMPADEDRLRYADHISRRGTVPGTRWYADNTREPIRDETLRDGLIAA
jgi:hypothetical protein